MSTELDLGALRALYKHRADNEGAMIRFVDAQRRYFPALLAAAGERDELRADLERADRIALTASTDANALERERDELKAEVAKLRTERLRICVPSLEVPGDRFVCEVYGQWPTHALEEIERVLNEEMDAETFKERGIKLDEHNCAWVTATCEGEPLYWLIVPYEGDETSSYRAKLTDAQCKSESLQAEVEQLRAALERELVGAPTDADFEVGGRYDYDGDCGNSDDVAKLYAARGDYEQAKRIRAALAAQEARDARSPAQSDGGAT